MADYITAIRTTDGDKKIDFNALANLPVTERYITDQERIYWNNKISPSDMFTSDTAAMYGLGSNAVPNDIFSFLGKYNLHYWRKEGVIEASYTIGTNQDFQMTNSGYVRVLYVGDDISVSDLGELSLVNPTEIGDLSSNTNDGITNAQALLNSCKGKFIHVERYNELSLFFKRSSDDAYVSSNDVYASVQLITGHRKTTDGNIEIVSSSNSNKYPVSGEVSGYVYDYIGIPYENMKNPVQVETGSYVGTGTYGKSNPNSITFNFIPKILFVTDGNGDDYKLVVVRGQTSSNVSTNGDLSCPVNIIWNGRTVSWSGTITFEANQWPEHQLNGHHIYHYCAIA